MHDPRNQKSNSKKTLKGPETLNYENLAQNFCLLDWYELHVIRNNGPTKTQNSSPNHHHQPGSLEEKKGGKIYIILVQN